MIHSWYLKNAGTSSRLSFCVSWICSDDFSKLSSVVCTHKQLDFIYRFLFCIYKESIWSDYLKCKSQTGIKHCKNCVFSSSVISSIIKLVLHYQYTVGGIQNCPCPYERAPPICRRDWAPVDIPTGWRRREGIFFPGLLFPLEACCTTYHTVLQGPTTLQSRPWEGSGTWRGRGKWSQ